MKLRSIRQILSFCLPISIKTRKQHLASLKVISVTMGIVFSIFLSTTASSSGYMVGYVTSWKNSTIDYSKYTHLIYSFSLPRSSGTISPVENPAKLAEIVRQAKAHNVKVLLAIGGWNGGDDGAWETFTKSSGAIDQFVRDSLYLVDAHGLDGIDLDWEYPSQAWQWNALVRKLGPALHNKGKLLTAAVAGTGWNTRGVGETDQLDFINIMSYDCNCPSNAPMAQAYEAMDTWSQKAPKHKLILGIPFYKTDNYESIHLQKARLAKERGHGIMMWEVSGANNNTLGKIINSLGGLDKGAGGGGATHKDCSAWSSNGNYNTGNIVNFENGSYIATNPNPGYIPNVSTWFWDAYDGNKCDVVVDEFEDCSQWSEAQNYQTDNIVKFENSFYIATNPNPGYIPTQSTWFWDSYSGSQCDNNKECSSWSANSEYPAGTVVKYNGKFYKATSSNPGYIPDVSIWYWDEVNASACGIEVPVCPQWVEGQNYNVGDAVLFEGNHYLTVSQNPGYIPNVSTWFWDAIASCPTN